MRTRLRLGLLLAAGIFVVPASYAGVSLETTRIIYPVNAEQTSLSIKNHDKMDVYLIQSWISDYQGNKTSDFIVTPPLFVINPMKENTFRIMAGTHKAWPQDRESVYYFHSKAIPSTTKDNNSKNTLQIATETVIKVFVRPTDLPSSPDSAPGEMRCSVNGNAVQFTNSSPYYVSMVNITADGEKIPSTMVPPKSSVNVTTKKGEHQHVDFQSINDFGAMSKTQACVTG